MRPPATRCVAPTTSFQAFLRAAPASLSGCACCLDATIGCSSLSPMRPAPIDQLQASRLALAPQAVALPADPESPLALPADPEPPLALPADPEPRAARPVVRRLAEQLLPPQRAPDRAATCAACAPPAPAGASPRGWALACALRVPPASYEMPSKST